MGETGNKSARRESDDLDLSRPILGSPKSCESNAGARFSEGAAESMQSAVAHIVSYRDDVDYSLSHHTIRAHRRLSRPGS